jgi:hypothetical protein
MRFHGRLKIRACRIPPPLEIRCLIDFCDGNVARPSKNFIPLRWASVPRRFSGISGGTVGQFSGLSGERQEFHSSSAHQVLLDNRALNPRDGSTLIAACIHGMNLEMPSRNLDLEPCTPRIRRRSRNCVPPPTDRAGTVAFFLVQSTFGPHSGDR